MNLQIKRPQITRAACIPQSVTIDLKGHSLHLISLRPSSLSMRRVSIFLGLRRINFFGTSDHWENILTLWEYLKIQLFQIVNKTSLTLPYLNKLPPLSLTLPGATFPSLRSLSQTFVSLILTFNARWHMKKLQKFGKINFGTAKVIFMSFHNINVAWGKL